jgi:hypothetical protein
MATLQGERGAAMVIVALGLTGLLLFAGLALDLGRGHLLQAQLQTAVDAGALAGALQVIPMLSLEVDRWLAVEDRREPVSPAEATGPWAELIGQGKWRQVTAEPCRWPHRCASDYRIVRAWPILMPGAEAAARETVALNAAWPGGPYGAVLESVDVRVDGAAASVKATATLRAPTHFLRLAGIPELRITRSSTAAPARLPAAFRPEQEAPVVRWGSRLTD